MPQSGYLVISDISGYSTFLHDSELEHARDSLSDLLNLLVSETRSPLRIVELEGDAVFSYAPSEDVPDARVLTGMVEEAYIAFRRALNLMVINTSCTCNACRLLPTLDLKFFVHHGSFAQQRVADHRKLMGNDVNLIHRLLKNTIHEAFGLKAYAAYSEQAVAKLELDRAGYGMLDHAEHYDDVGEVNLCVKDMHGVWEQGQDRLRVRVEPEAALLMDDFDFDLEPAELWAYITEPSVRNLLLGSDSQRLEPRPGGGTGIGATYVCAHGENVILQTIVDWEPPVTYTVKNPWPVPNTISFSTCVVEPTPQGSRLRVLLGPARGPLPFRVGINLMAKSMGSRGMREGVWALKGQIAEQQAAQASTAAPGE